MFKIQQAKNKWSNQVKTGAVSPGNSKQELGSFKLIGSNKLGSQELDLSKTISNLIPTEAIAQTAFAKIIP